jgi:DNA-nicking Smr family endonuclease
MIMGVRRRENHPGPPAASGRGQAPVGDDAERLLFEAEMRDVRRLTGATRVPMVRVPAGSRRQDPAPGPRRGGESRGTGPNAVVLVRAAPGGVVSPGGDRAWLRDLRRDDVRPESRLDLHGVTGDEADNRVDRFLAAAIRAGVRRVLVIHGRGLRSGPDGPVLPARVKARLAAAAKAGTVLAYATAPARLGGEGATIVLLRRTIGR